MRRSFHILFLLLSAVLSVSCTDRPVPADMAYYERYGSAEEKMKAWYELGRMQKEEGDLHAANISLMKAERWAAEDTGVFYKALIWQALSDICHEGFLFEESLKYAGLSYVASSSISDTARADLSRYRMAQELGNLERYAEADSLYRVLLAEGKFSTADRACLLADYAMLVLYRTEDWASAVHWFEAALAEADTLGRPVLNDDHRGAYAYALLRMGKKAQSEAIFRQLAAEAADESVYKMWRSRADAWLGDYAAAYEQLSFASEIRYQDVTRALRQSTLSSQRDYIAEENAALRASAARHRMRSRIALLGLLGLLAGTTAVVVGKQRKVQQEREAFLESVHSLSSDLDVARDERADLRKQYIKMCQTHFQQLGRINEMLHNIAWDKDSPLYQELRKTVRVIRDDDKSQKEFERLLDETLGNVMTHFRETFPGKKERYYQLAGFLFAGFDAATISSILYNCTKENVYIQKTRLKKAIRETSGPYTEQFLQLLS